jgi:diguanylate cyclase (GGDEF)-like protein/PAS domain S-box-containing protein
MPSSSKSGRLRLPLAVLAAGVALSLLLYHATEQEIERGAQARFDVMATDVARKVEDGFSSYVEVLNGLRALVSSSRNLTRQQFRTYVDALGLHSNYPGFRALNFAPYIEAQDLSGFEQRMRREYPGFSVRSTVAGTMPDYYPLAFVEPMEGNEGLLGNDMGALPFARKALEHARDTGELTSSGRLIRIGGLKSDLGLAIRLPVYDVTNSLRTIDDRRAAYIGSVGAGFRVADVMREISTGSNTLRIRLFDSGQVSAPQSEAVQLYDSQEASVPSASRLERKLPFELGGRRWIVEVSDERKVIVGPLDRSLPLLIFAAGSAISALLAGILYSLNTSRWRAIRLADAMTENLRRSERRLYEAQHLAIVGSWILDQDGQLQCSDEARRILGFEANSHPTLSALLDRVPSTDRAAVHTQMTLQQRENPRSEFEHALCLPDGTERWVHVIAELAEEDGRQTLRGTVRDDTQRHKAALRLQLDHDVARLLVSDGPQQQVVEAALRAICLHLGFDCAAMWSKTRQGRLRCAPSWQGRNDAKVERFLNFGHSLVYRPDEGALGQAWSTAEVVVFNTGDLASAPHARVSLAREAGLAVGVVVPMSTGDHASALEFFRCAQRAVDADTLESLRAIALQIGQYRQRKQAEQALRHIAMHDGLTGLCNRQSLQQRLGWALKRSQRDHKRLAVMFLDLDNFKRINDTLGHGAGDELIQACAGRISAVLREGDTVARFGGDEFVLLLEDLNDAADAASVADKVMASCADPFFIEGQDLHVTASIGVSIYPEDGTDAESLLKNADTAMYRAKERGRGNYQFYAAQMNAQGTERLMLESGLRRAAERGELELHYQPKMNLRTRRITGVEALMRWRHPALGMVSPAQFIPIAEETGLIESIGRWALRQACADAVAWDQQGLPPLQMSVNLSPRQLNNRRLVSDVSAILSETGFDPSRLELEITESAVMRNPEHAAGLLNQLREQGVSLAIDDFGTGYSSLSYLTRFALTTVKIDRSFVKDLADSPASQALTAGIVTLAHGLGMKVVAEGVETVEQFGCLRSHDCDEIQGYWLCKPLPADEALAFMARHLRQPIAAVAA